MTDIKKVKTCKRCTKSVLDELPFCHECRNPFHKRLTFVFVLSGKTKEDILRETKLSQKEIYDMFQSNPDYFPSSSQLIELKRFFGVGSMDYFFRAC